MKLKKEHREILNQLDPEEKKTVLEILERTDAVISKEEKKQKSDDDLRHYRSGTVRLCAGDGACGYGQRPCRA